MEEAFWPAVVAIIVAVIFGTIAYLVGGKASSFWWGLFLGPFGVVVSAVISEGEKTREKITALTVMMQKQSKQQKETTAPSVDISGHRIIQCPQCGSKLRVSPQDNSVICPKCQSSIEVE